MSAAGRGGEADRGREADRGGKAGRGTRDRAADREADGAADPAGHHSVYVVLLDPAVLEVRKFLDANPNAAPWTTCLYVGMTGLDPEERFANHKSGHKSNRFVRDFGIRLMPELVDRPNPMSFEDAVVEEAALADRLRSAGYAVWQK